MSELASADHIRSSSRFPRMKQGGSERQGCLVGIIGSIVKTRRGLLRKRATFAGSTCLPGKLSSNVTLAGGCEGQAALSYARLSPAHGASS